MNKLPNDTRYKGNDRVTTEIWSTKHNVPNFSWRVSTMCIRRYHSCTRRRSRRRRSSVIWKKEFCFMICLTSFIFIISSVRAQFACVPLGFVWTLLWKSLYAHCHVTKFFSNRRQHLNLSIAPKHHTIRAWTTEIIEGIDVFVSLGISSIKRNGDLQVTRCCLLSIA